MPVILVRDKGERELVRGLGRVTRQKRFLVQLTPGDDPNDAASAEGVPQYNQVHPDDEYQFVRQIRILRNPDGPAFYDLEIDYGDIGAVIGGQIETPKLMVRGESAEYPADHDALGVPYMNSLGKLYETTTTRRKSDANIVGSVYLSGFNYGYAFTHQDHVNNKPLACLNGAPPGTVWLRSFSQQEDKLPDGSPCVKMTLDLVIRNYYVPAGRYYYYKSGVGWTAFPGDANGKVQLGWMKVQINNSYEGFEDVGGVGVYQSFKTGGPTGNTFVRVPEMIDIDGYRLAAGEGAYFLCFDEFEMADFSEIGLR